jgi:D-tyrosyl-tRNA(Tyr) deacylase
MRLVVQRVKSASVETGGKTVGKISKGYLVLLGVNKDDGLDDVLDLAEKLYKLRIMPDSKNKMNLNLKDSNGEVLLVSQFTLYADTSRGNRPSFVAAAAGEKAEKLYNRFIRKLKEMGLYVQTGKFGSYMDISAHLDGPVTIILES